MDITNSNTILLIEDNPADARLVEIYINESSLEGFSIVHCISLGDGLSYLDKKEVAAVLLDLTLPDSSGFETLSTVLKKYPDSNVIVMTGLADKELGLKSVQAGAQDFLVKGNFDEQLLVKSLRYAIERKQNTELIKEKDVAKRSAELKEQFLASVSHEMRTPMNAILGMSNLLTKTDLNEEQKEYVGSIKESSHILLGIINDILEISSLKNNVVVFEEQPFDFYRLLQQLVEVMKYKAQEKSLEFDLNIEESLPRVLIGDALRLNQILYNLVGNAIKFTKQGKIGITAENAGNDLKNVTVCISVSDTGIGIPKDKQSAIFETFTRIRTKGEIFEGTGLGLSIAKNLVENQGGTIAVDSEPGEGSIFTVTLPFGIGKMAQLEEQEVKKGIKIDSNITILVVEDHKMNQLVARKTLEKHLSGVRVIVANNGKEALYALNEETVDVILMDIQMPVMDGYEATEAIRKRSDGKEGVPIIAMTAHANIVKDERFSESGMDAILLKPFSPDELIEKIIFFVDKNRPNHDSFTL